VRQMSKCSELQNSQSLRMVCKCSWCGGDALIFLSKRICSKSAKIITPYLKDIDSASTKRPEGESISLRGVLGYVDSTVTAGESDRWLHAVQSIM